MQCRAREERPGRKTDLLDAEWLVHLLECGLLRGWLIPPADIKAARDVIRYRRKLVEHRTSKLQRLGNVLQDAGIKADSVASSVTPKSVRAMVEALIDGERRPAVLADLARGSMRSKIPDLQRALEGRFDDHHALMCRLHLAHLDHRHRTSTKPRRPPARPGAHPDRRGHRHPRPTTGSQRRPTAVLMWNGLSSGRLVLVASGLFGVSGFDPMTGPCGAPSTPPRRLKGARPRCHPQGITCVGCYCR
nr:transposase [Mycobacterium tuberculosis]